MRGGSRTAPTGTLDVKKKYLSRFTAWPGGFETRPYGDD
jgi:hypothetical protein